MLGFVETVNGRQEQTPVNSQNSRKNTPLPRLRGGSIEVMVVVRSGANSRRRTHTLSSPLEFSASTLRTHMHTLYSHQERRQAGQDVHDVWVCGEYVQVTEWEFSRHSFVSQAVLHFAVPGEAWWTACATAGGGVGGGGDFLIG